MALHFESRLALPFKNTTYGIYAAGNAVSLVGTWMQRISVSWLTWEMTHSGFWLGVVAFADFFPGLVVGPLAGAFADRTEQLTVVKSSQIVSLLQATVLFVLTATNHLNIWGLTALTALQGAVVAFNQPARLALVPSLVAETDLASAVALNSVIFNLARFLGPMAAGLTIVWSGVAASFAVNAASYVPFILALWWIRIDDGAATAPKRRNFTTDFKEGIRYTAKHPAIGALLLLLTAIGIGGRPLNQLLPAFAAQIFHLGAGGFSIGHGCRRHFGRAVAWTPPVHAPPSHGAYYDIRRRCGGNWHQRDKRPVGCGSVRGGFRFRPFVCRHCDSDNHPAFVRAYHARSCNGRLWLDIPWRAWNRCPGSGNSIGALWAPLADYRRCADGHSCGDVDFE